MATTDRVEPRWLCRIAWFVGIWAAGVASVGMVAALVRWWLVP